MFTLCTSFDRTFFLFVAIPMEYSDSFQLLKQLNTLVACLGSLCMSYKFAKHTIQVVISMGLLGWTGETALHSPSYRKLHLPVGPTVLINSQNSSSAYRVYLSRHLIIAMYNPAHDTSN